ncbi:MAG: signal peptidase I [Pseudonocardiaceae bacterium]|nr:MAG: signal peptidase I [Pseudonocardiaceae bacterium]
MSPTHAAATRSTRPAPLRRISGAVLALVVVVVVALAVVVAVLPWAVGGKALTVLSGSMEPGLPVGSVAVVKPEPADRIAVGDVIEFVDRDQATGASRVVTHRVVQVQPGPAFVTKGDANATPDPHVVAAAAVGGVLWYHVPWVGGLRDRLVGPAGLVVLGGIVLLGAAVLLLRSSGLRDADR